MKKLISIAILSALCAAPAAAAPSTLTLKASPTVVVYGGSTTLSGKIVLTAPVKSTFFPAYAAAGPFGAAIAERCCPGCRRFERSRPM